MACTPEITVLAFAKKPPGGTQQSQAVSCARRTSVSAWGMFMQVPTSHERVLIIATYTGFQGAGLAHMIRAFLAVLVAFVYSGAFLFLSPNSQVILYGFYSVLLMLVLLYIYVARGLPNVRLMMPYLIWLLLYGVWGTLISPINQAILPDTLRLLFRNGILLLACTVVLMDRRSLGILIRWIEVAVILNA